MAGSIKSFFLKGGWARLPWKNSWFSLAVFSAALSAGLLVADVIGVAGKGKTEGQQGQPSSSSSAPSFSFFSKPGSLTVDATPAGATVRIAGITPQSAPANFQQINAGHYDVTVSAEGYETGTQSVDIHAGAPSSLSFALQRSTGSLGVTTVPTHVAYTLRTVGGGQIVNSGKTPINLSNLPTGQYEVYLESPHDGTINRPVTVPAHQTATQTIDMVQNNAASTASPEAAKVVLRQADASTLSAADKTGYIAALNKEFTEYVRVGAFPEAQGAIDALTAAGQNTQPLAQHLSDIRNGFEQKISDSVKDLISQGKLGAARAKLKAAEDDVPDDVANRLNTTFTPTLGPYAQQIDSAVASANAGDPQAGYTALQPLAQQHPDDVTVALAMAHLLTRMPPERTRISTQLSALQKFDAGDLISVDATDLQQLEAKLQAELTKYDQLQAAVDAEKKPSGGSSPGRIAALEREIARDKASIAGASGVNSAVDSVTSGLFHTHVRVVDVSAKQAEIARDQQRIQELENAQLQVKSAASTAQQNLDNFRNATSW